MYLFKMVQGLVKQLESIHKLMQKEVLPSLGLRMQKGVKESNMAIILNDNYKEYY